MINTTRTKYVLVAATVLHLILLAYIATIEFRHDVRLPVAGFAFFGTIPFTDYEAYFAVAFSLGIIVVPFTIDKSGFLNNYPDEPPDADLEGGYTNKEAEEHIDRLAGYIRNHTLSTGLLFSALGTSILWTLTACLRDETAYNTRWQKELTKSFGHLNLPLLLLALGILVIGVALIGLYIKRKSRAGN